jgi:hypothetical protein
MGRQNPVADYHTDLLQANNLAANTSSTEDCAFLLNAVTAWLMSSGSVPSSHRFTNEYDDTVYLMWGQVLPIRCPWQNITQNVTQQDNGVITLCPDGENRLPTQFGGTYLPSRLCDVWSEGPDDVADATTEFFADEFDLRVGGLSEMIRKTTAPANFGDGMTEAEFYVKVIYNGGHFISLVYVPLHDQSFFAVRELLTPLLLSISLLLKTNRPFHTACIDARTGATWPHCHAW